MPLTDRDRVSQSDSQGRRETYAMLYVSVAQAPTALVTFTSSAW